MCTVTSQYSTISVGLALELHISDPIINNNNNSHVHVHVIIIVTAKFYSYRISKERGLLYGLDIAMDIRQATIL